MGKKKDLEEELKDEKRRSLYFVTLCYPFRCI